MLYSPQENQGENKPWRAGDDKTGQQNTPGQTPPGKNMPDLPGQQNPAEKDWQKNQGNQPYGNIEEQDET